MAWRRGREVSNVIAGATRVEQVEQKRPTVDRMTLSAKEIAEIERLRRGELNRAQQAHVGPGERRTHIHRLFSGVGESVLLNISED